MINHVLDIAAAVIEINGSCEAKFRGTSCASQPESAFSTASFVRCCIELWRCVEQQHVCSRAFEALPSQVVPTEAERKGLRIQQGEAIGGGRRKVSARVCSPQLLLSKAVWRGITEWQGLEGTSVGHPAQPPAQAGSPRAGCTAPRPGGA